MQDEGPLKKAMRGRFALLKHFPPRRAGSAKPREDAEPISRTCWSAARPCAGFHCDDASTFSRMRQRGGTQKNRKKQKRVDAVLLFQVEATLHTSNSIHFIHSIHFITNFTNEKEIHFAIRIL
jgi:hypothetical protein